jgi:hypothetical protein
MNKEQLVKSELAGATEFEKTCLVPLCPPQIPHDVTYICNFQSFSDIRISFVVKSNVV